MNDFILCKATEMFVENKKLRAIFLMPDEIGSKAYNKAKEAGLDINVVIVNDLEALERLDHSNYDILLSFSTGVIVPKWIIDKPNLILLNIHAASSDYPGRDPHHFAVYHGATKYGATLHFMSSKVDAGPIVDMELFDVTPYVTPISLLDQANQAAWVLLERLLKKLADNVTLTPLDGAAWGTRKTTRKMFEELCKVDPSMTEHEFLRRMLATSMPDYNNLYLELYGYRFRLDKKQ